MWRHGLGLGNLSFWILSLIASESFYSLFSRLRSSLLFLILRFGKYCQFSVGSNFMIRITPFLALVDRTVYLPLLSSNRVFSPTFPGFLFLLPFFICLLATISPFSFCCTHSIEGWDVLCLDNKLNNYTIFVTKTSCRGIHPSTQR